jgi:hypothetical protein
MDTSIGRKTSADIPTYPHKKIDSDPICAAPRDIEAGDKEMDVGEDDLAFESNNSSTDVYVIAEEEGPKRRSFNIYYQIGHAVLWLLMTGYGISFLILSPFSAAN